MAYGSIQIESLASHFKDPLKKANFDRRVVHKEWHQLKNFARSHHSGLDAHSLWEKIFIYRCNEFKNVCLITKIVFSLATSNSMVERAFSLLILLLSDKPILLKHETIESLMKINLSDKIWTEKEKNEILERAVVYLSKQQGKKIAEPQKKVSCMQSNNENTQERLSESHEDKVLLMTDPEREELKLFYFIFYVVTFNLFFGLFIDFVLTSFVYNIYFTF